MSAALLFRKVTGKFGADESTRRFSARLEVSKTPMVWSVALPDCIEERKTEEEDGSGNAFSSTRVSSRVVWEATLWKKDSLGSDATDVDGPVAPDPTLMEPLTARQRSVRAARRRAERAGAVVERAPLRAPLPLGRRQPLGVAQHSACWERLATIPYVHIEGIAADLNREIPVL